MYRVNFKNIEKDLYKIPKHIREKLFSWAQAVELEGIEKVRQIPGYNDEGLKGKRKGQRSIRLSRSYRAIYKQEGNLGFSILLIEVNKHEY